MSAYPYRDNKCDWFINFDCCFLDQSHRVSVVAKLSDLQIKARIKGNARFENKADGDGFYLCYRETMAAPMWRYRYRLAGKRKKMFIGTYGQMSVAEAQQEKSSG